jgi:nicotinamide mononucleotide transporter
LLPVPFRWLFASIFTPMSIQELGHIFASQVRATSLLEWVAILFAVAEVLLARSNKVLLYPAGIISTVIYTYLFIQPSVKLYADAILNSYYFIMSVYGWLLWTKRKDHTAVEISMNTRQDWIKTILIGLIAWGLLYVLLTIIFPRMFSWYTASDVAVWDAFISAAAWSGMWLLAKRKVENWLLLNISNIVAIPLYIYKGMPFTACLTLFLFIVAVYGYIDWKRIYKASLQVATA